MTFRLISIRKQFSWPVLWCICVVTLHTIGILLTSRKLPQHDRWHHLKEVSHFKSNSSHKSHHSSSSLVSNRTSNMVTNDELIAYNSSRPIACSMIGDSVHVINERPFARGNVKAAWKATDLDGRQLVLKLPAVADSLEGRKRFMVAIRQELKFLIRIGRHKHAMEYYGHCLGTKAPSLAVEGPLLNWQHFIYSNQPWYMRLMLAYSFSSLLVLLQQRHLVHCDWKTDQVAVSDQFVVKLVDLKSLRYYRSERSPWLATSCRKDSDCFNDCFRWQHGNGFQVPDLHCNVSSSHCVGLNSKSMVYASAHMFLTPLLVNRLQDLPPMKSSMPQEEHPFSHSVQQLLNGATQERANHRWNAVRVRDFTANLIKEYDAHSLFETNRKKLENEYRSLLNAFLSDSDERCKNRYC